MMFRRAFFAVLVIAVTGPLTAVERARSVDPRSESSASPVVVRGTVDVVLTPYSVVLADGTEVGIEPATDWVGAAGVADLLPGDEIVVAGHQVTGAVTRSLTAGGIRVVSGDRRVVPVGAPVCLPPPPAKARDLEHGARWGIVVAPPPSKAGPARKEEVELDGVVVSVDEAGFELETETAERYTVVVDEDTEYKGIEGLDGLMAEDAVRVRGELEGSILAATRVELREEDPGDDGGGGGDDGSGGSSSGDGVDFEADGVVVELQPPDRFLLSDQRSYVVDGMTVFDEQIVSYAGLAAGQLLEVKAVYEGGGVYRAIEVEYEGDEDGGQGYEKLESTVESISATSLSLTDGSVVLLTPTTVFDGDADRFEDVRPGWHAEILALRNAAGDLIARSVRCEDLEPATTVGHEFEPREAVLVIVEGAVPDLVAERHGATVAGSVSSRSVLFTWGQEIDDELLAQLEADPDVEAVEPNFLFRDPESVRRRFVIVDRSPTSAEYTGQAAAVRHGLAKALTVADGGGALVAVMDTGVDRCHPLLFGHLVGGGLDLVDGDLSPWETQDGLDQDNDGEVDEAAGHGTFVASLVALAAPGAKIIPYRVLDDDGGGTAFNLALALADAIERGVDVINLSLAYHERSVVVDLLLEEAERRGVVVVAAAGNDGASTLPFPAIDSHVLAVTALRQDGVGLAEFANRGDKAVVAAIGEEVYGGLFGGEYGTSSGTSLAAPFAAAGAALAKGLDPGVSAEIVRGLLVQWGTPVTDGIWSGRSLDLGAAVTAIRP